MLGEIYPILGHIYPIEIPSISANTRVDIPSVRADVPDTWTDAPELRHRILFCVSCQCLPVVWKPDARRTWLCFELFNSHHYEALVPVCHCLLFHCHIFLSDISVSATWFFSALRCSG